MNSFKILTPAYNCVNEIEQTLFSVIGQSYKNWEMTVIDDLSTDDTASFVEEFAEKHQVAHKIKVIRRKEKHGEVRNTLVEVAKLSDEDIVVRLDAGDWITDLGCLEILNSIYQEYDPAVVWTAHRWAFTNQNISGQIDTDKSMYEQPWRTSHLKTFRVKDFKGLNPKNFIDENGDYIMIACDQAVFLPMLERARRKKRNLIFLPMIMYHYNINLNKENLFHNKRSYAQRDSALWIRERGYIE